MHLLQSGVDPAVIALWLGHETNGHDAAIFVMKTLLASKLGVSEALESGAVSFRTRLRAWATLSVERHAPGI